MVSSTICAAFSFFKVNNLTFLPIFIRKTLFFDILHIFELTKS